jgi:hypothetical protein
MPDEKAPSSGAFLLASLMYFCSGQPMHYCSGVDSRLLRFNPQPRFALLGSRNADVSDELSAGHGALRLAV